jgi:hypothetical protein
VLILCCWLAVAGQLTALTAGRYAPYPDASEQPPAGPFRTIATRIGGALRTRRHQWAQRQAVGG